MAPSDLPIGTVGSDADVGPDPRPEATLRARVAELERENDLLRAHVDEQHRARQDLIDRYERLLAERAEVTARRRPRRCDADAPADGLLRRFARRLGLR